MIVSTPLNIQRMITTQTQGFCQRHFKHRGHFIFAGVIVKIGRNNPHDGCHLKTGHAVYWRQDANHFNGLRRNGHLFLSFAQCGGNERGVRSIHRATRKCHLASMFTQM
ncbi:hypothetical protein D3C86_1670070 [compost metagenome]